jgi:ribosome-binding factor A
VSTGKLPYKRAQRVADLLRRVISEILLNKLHHLGLESVNVTGVTLTDDLKHARVFYRVLQADRRIEAAKALSKSAKIIRKEAAHEMKMRYTPNIRFEYDDSLEYGDRIEELLSSVRASEEE